MSAEFSIWLLPAADDAARLDARVAALAGRLGGAVFMPHVTIQGDLGPLPAGLAAALPALAAQAPVQHWTVRAVERSEHFFRSLYLRFDRHPAFEHWQAAVRALSGTEVGLSPFPHLSMAYTPAHAALEGLAGTLAAEIVGATLRFDHLALVRSSASLPIVQWECLERYPLSTPSPA